MRQQFIFQGKDERFAFQQWVIYRLMVCPTAQLAIDLDHADFHDCLTHTVMPGEICQNTEQLPLPDTCHDFCNMISPTCKDNELYLEQ